jgi:hypothetical protein
MKTGGDANVFTQDELRTRTTELLRHFAINGYKMYIA